jgi:hypothetical protein
MQQAPKQPLSDEHLARLRRVGFQPGIATNPTGMTRTRQRAAEYLELFRNTHKRAPNAVEATQIKAAGAMAARLESNRTLVDDQVRAGNLLQRILERLKLDGAPSQSDAGAFPTHGIGKP